MILSLFPATILLTFAYLVLFAASQSEGGIRTVGKLLATWIFLFALLPPSMGAYLTFTGQCPIEKIVAGLMEHEQ